jgi:hypothetical protein
MTSRGNLPNWRRILNRESLARLAAGSMLLALVAAAGWSYWTQGVVYVLCSQKLTATEKIEGLQQFFARFGLAAPLRQRDVPGRSIPLKLRTTARS